MLKRLALIIGMFFLIPVATPAPKSGAADPAHWPQWRGPFFNGVARTAAPVEFSDTKNIK